MIQLCPRCQRANPPDASFCHFDGCVLRQGPESSGVFIRDFVFPSGRRCRSFEDFVQGCYYEWEDARSLLHEGAFAGFLGGLGRADLAQAAREAQAQPDLDIALMNFLSGLPAGQVQGPKLGLEPRRLVVGPMRAGEQQAASVQVLNEGRGILQGKVTVSEGYPWLKIDDEKDPISLSLRTPREQVVALRIDTSGLIVGQNYSGKLVVVSNGGVAEVPLRLDLSARPFSQAPYQGAENPQELARKMRDNPHPAAPLLESGEVARWFEANGWTYPIAGKAAPGLASVQQFFEELGLAQAPRVQISQEEFHVTASGPELIPLQVTVRTAERKLVYARAESDSPWLVVKTPVVSGQIQAVVDFVVDATNLEDKRYSGALKVVANAGQTFLVDVYLEIAAPKKNLFGGRKPVPGKAAPVAVIPATAWLPKESAAPATPRGASMLRTVLAGALLGLAVRLLLVAPGDVYARLLGGAGREPAFGSLASWVEAPGADDGFLRLMALATWWVGAVVGVLLAWRAGGRWADLCCGMFAGAVAGLAGGATLGCALVVVDALPRALLGSMAEDASLGPALATPLWLLAALAWWTLIGGVLGLGCGLGGRAGREWLAWLASPLAGALRWCGLGKAARVFDQFV